MLANRQLALGAACLLLAAVIFSLGFTKIAFLASRTEVTVYPAAFLALLGIGLVGRVWWARMYNA